MIALTAPNKPATSTASPRSKSDRQPSRRELAADLWQMHRLMVEAGAHDSAKVLELAAILISETPAQTQPSSPAQS